MLASRCVPILGVLALLAAATACAPTAPAPVPTPTPSPAPGPVSFTVVAAGPVSRYDAPDPALMIAGDEAAFRQLWSAHIAQSGPEPVLQQLDFAQQVTATVFYGRRPTGGFGITVARVERRGGQVVITAETKEPAPGALLPQVITSPWETVAISKAAVPGWDKLHYVLVNTAGATLAEADAGP